MSALTQLRNKVRGAATPATPATRTAERDNSAIEPASNSATPATPVAEIATLTPRIARPAVKSSKSSSCSKVPYLLTDIEAVIAHWLDHIGEHDPALRAGCLNACRRDPELRAYFLRRAEEAPVNDHKRVLRDLEANPERVRAVEVIDADADPVRILVAIRDVGVCELLVARDKWDPFQFLALLTKPTEQEVTDA